MISKNCSGTIARSNFKGLFFYFTTSIVDVFWNVSRSERQFIFEALLFLYCPHKVTQSFIGVWPIANLSWQHQQVWNNLFTSLFRRGLYYKRCNDLDCSERVPFNTMNAVVAFSLCLFVCFFPYFIFRLLSSLMFLYLFSARLYPFRISFGYPLEEKCGSKREITESIVSISSFSQCCNWFHNTKPCNQQYRHTYIHIHFYTYITYIHIYITHTHTHACICECTHIQLTEFFKILFPDTCKLTNLSTVTAP